MYIKAHHVHIDNLLDYFFLNCVFNSFTEQMLVDALVTQTSVSPEHAEYRSSSCENFFLTLLPTWQFWDPGGVKLESLCNFSIVGCQWTVNCLLGSWTRSREAGHVSSNFREKITLVCTESPSGVVISKCRQFQSFLLVFLTKYLLQSKLGWFKIID